MIRARVTAGNERRQRWGAGIQRRTWKCLVLIGSIGEVTHSLRSLIMATSHQGPSLDIGSFQRIIIKPMNGTNYAEIAKNGLIRSIGPTGIATPGAYAHVATDVAAVAQTALSAVNAVVGVANLAVGIYSAYQVTAMRSEVRQQLELVQGLLSDHSKKLDLIYASQEKHDEKLSLLLARVEAGFTETANEVWRAVSALRTDELRNRFVALDRAKKSLVSSFGEADVDPQDILEAERCAANLIDFVRARLLADELPLEGRQALWFARVDAEIIAQDCRLLRRGDTARARVVEETNLLIDELRQEMRRLNSGVTAWQLATFVTTQTARYQVLSAALEQRIDTLNGIVQEREVKLVLPETAFQPSSESVRREQSLPLLSVPDYTWYIRSFALDERKFRVASVNAVSRGTLEKHVGAPPEMVSLEYLRRLADPVMWTDYNGLVEQLTGMEPKVVRLALDVPRPPSGQPTSMLGMYAFTWRNEPTNLKMFNVKGSGFAEITWIGHLVRFKRLTVMRFDDYHVATYEPEEKARAALIFKDASVMQVRVKDDVVEVSVVGAGETDLAQMSSRAWHLALEQK